MRPIALIATVLAGLALACGGSSGGTGGSMSTPAPTPSAGVVAGVVGGTSDAPQINHNAMGMGGAAVTLDGLPATPAMVQPGMVMVGTTPQGGMGMGSGMGSGSYTMQTMQLMSSFMGQVQSTDRAAVRMMVMGQMIQVNALSQLAQENQDGTYGTLAFTDFQAGDFVAVHGAFLADGTFAATRVEHRKTGTDTGQNSAMGQVSNLNATAKTFTLGTWTVNYSAATVKGTLANGAWAQVRGTVAGSTISAAWVNVMGAMGDPGSGMGLRGMATNLNTTAKTFHLMYLTVNYAQATVVGTLAENAMVEVQGTLAAGSTTTVNAARVEVTFYGMGGGMGPGSGSSDMQGKGAITALNLGAMTLTVSGTSYWMDASTLIMSHDATLTPAQLKVGDWVAVMADSTRKNSAEYAYATRIAEMDGMGGGGMGGGSGMGDLMGAVTSVNAGARTLVLNGYKVTVTSSTTYRSSGSSIDAATFWSRVQVGSRVEAIGTASGTSFTATQLMLSGMGGGMGGGM